MKKAKDIDGKYWRTALRDRDIARKKKRLAKPKLINGKKPLDHAMDEIERKMKNQKKQQEKEQKEVKKGKKTVVEDVLDSNYSAEVDPDKVPSSKPTVLWKKQGKQKGVNKLKSFIKEKKK